MKNTNEIRNRLQNDPDTYVMWMDDAQMPPGVYDLEEVNGIRINLMLRDNMEDVYLVYILPGDTNDVFDAYLRRMGDSEMVYMFGISAQNPEDFIRIIIENLPDYLGLV